MFWYSSAAVLTMSLSGYACVCVCLLPAFDHLAYIKNMPTGTSPADGVALVTDSNVVFAARVNTGFLLLVK